MARFAPVDEGLPLFGSFAIGDGLVRDIFGLGRYTVFTGAANFVVPPSITKLRVRVWGAGGGGACSNGAGKRACGGGGGGFAAGIYTVVPGTVIPVAVGRGGKYVSDSVSTAGGPSSFGTFLSATGGGAGVVKAPGINCPGASGGNGVGGTIINARGGNSGGIIHPGTARGFATGGGGAGSLLGDGGSSGDINCTDDFYLATGGGGLFSSGSITAAQPATTGGGGTASASSDHQGGHSRFASIAQISATDPHGADNPDKFLSRFVGEFLLGGGGAGNARDNAQSSLAAGNGGPGGGGGGRAWVSAQRAGDGGVFGGGGGAALMNSGSGGNGGIGGGGGSAAGTNGYAGDGCFGGHGLVIVEW